MRSSDQDLRFSRLWTIVLILGTLKTFLGPLKHLENEQLKDAFRETYLFSVLNQHIPSSHKINFGVHLGVGCRNTTSSNNRRFQKWCHVSIPFIKRIKHPTREELSKY